MGKMGQRSVEINLPCRRNGHPAPITISLVRNLPRIWPEIRMTVVVHDRIAGNDFLTLTADTAADICAFCADALEMLYEQRDVAISPSLQDDADVGSYLAFRAQDLEAEEISIMGEFNCYLDLSLDPCDELDKRLSEFDWYRREKELLAPFAWVIAFRGFLFRRSELPAMVAKLREIAGPK
jgi:hypothetical protein